MDWVDRWFRRRRKGSASSAKDAHAQLSIASEAISSFDRAISGRSKDQAARPPLSLQLLLPRPVAWTEDRLTEALQSFHPTTTSARVEFASRTFEREPGDANDAAANRSSGVFRIGAGDSLADFKPETIQPTVVSGTASWAHHQVHILAMNRPMEWEVMERMIAPAHYDDGLKAEARRSTAGVVLLYTGVETDRHEQYVALGVVAGAMSQVGRATIVANEAARASLPAGVLVPDPDQPIDMIRHLRDLPLLSLYCGFAKYEVEDLPGLWTRTHGCDLLGLPDLAWHCDSHESAGDVFSDLTDILNHYRNADPEAVSAAAGMTFDTGADQLLRMRYPTPEEGFLRTTGELLVVEPVLPEAWV